MKNPVLILVSLIASLSLISCSNQSKASSNKAGMKTAFTIGSMPDYIATSVDKLYQEASIVIVGKFEKDNKSFVERYTIVTESHMKVNKVLKGSLADSEMKNGIDIVYYGGEVTLDTYLKNTPPVPEKVDSKDIVHKPKQYSKQEREFEKVVYKVEQQANKDKDHNSEIMVFLSRNPASNNYFVLADAFGYRKINNKGAVFNPITNSYEKVNFYPTN